MVERETRRKLKVNNGGEYHGPFEAYCKTYGIKLEKTLPKTPQLNGVEKRMNQTINERVRCMLSYAKLPKSFQGKVVKTVVDVINLSSASPLDEDILEEIWLGQKASHNYLKVFGCRAFIHIPKDKQGKLDSKTKQYIYLGSPKEEYSY